MISVSASLGFPSTSSSRSARRVSKKAAAELPEKYSVDARLRALSCFVSPSRRNGLLSIISLEILTDKGCAVNETRRCGFRHVGVR